MEGPRIFLGFFFVGKEGMVSGVWKAGIKICRPSVVWNLGDIDRFLLSVGVQGIEPFFEVQVVRFGNGNLGFGCRSTDLGV